MKKHQKHNAKPTKNIKKNSETEKSLQSVEISFDIFENFLKIPFRKNDVTAIAIREMVLRSHKTLQIATLSALAGIEIPTISLLRDLIEIEFLLRYFIINPTEVSTWWHADRETRIKKYSPAKLRKAITKKFPELKKPMEDDYFGHCEIAAHPTPKSLKLQSELGNNSLFYSSKDQIFAWICLMEVSFHATRLAQIVAQLGDILYPKSDLKAENIKLQKIMANLVNKKFAAHLLYHKLNKAEKKHKTKSGSGIIDPTTEP